MILVDYLGYPLWYVKNKLGASVLSNYKLIYLNSSSDASLDDYRLIKISNDSVYVALFKEEIREENLNHE